MTAASTTTTSRPVPISPSVLVDLLAGDKVLAAARKLLAARARREAALRSPNEDTSANGQPRKTALFAADRDGRQALDELVDAIDRAADRLAREAISR